MADSDFSVYARIQADTSNFEKGMKNAQTSASNLSKSFGNLSKVITKALSFVGVAFSAKAIADFGKTSVQSATQATKQFKILDNTVKATGADAWTSTKQLEGLAKELSNATNYSVTELEEMQSVLLGFRNITDDTFSEASEAILDMATVMGMDLKSATQTVGKALDDPIKGLDSLRRQGFQFTDEQKKELAQLVKNGEQIKAQKIILDELAQSYGGAARAGQDSFAKQRHAMENLKDELGGKLIPVLQVFAEENTKVLDALREKIEQMDFSKAVNVVTNLKNIFTKRFEEIKQRVTVAKDTIVDFLKRFNFGPVVSILDTLIGHLVETVKMFREMQGLNFGSLKEGLIELSNSEAFEKFATFINAIVDVSHGILEEVKKVWPEIRDTIVNAIIGIWNKIKEFFEKSDNALNESGQKIHSWADLFWEELDNIYRIAQDLLKGVTHLLKGDWAVAWEYAKLAVLRVADGVLDAISTIANGMPKIINKIIDEWNRVLGWINKGLEKLNKDPIDLVPEFKSVDLSDVTGVADKIEEVENKIQELTGAAADNGISHLDKLSGRWKGFTAGVLGDIEALTEGTEEAAEKIGETTGKVGNVVKTTFAEVSEWDSKLLSQRLKGLKEYEAEYLDVTKQIIEQERKEAMLKAKNDEDKEKIALYYLGEIEKAEEDYHKAVAEKYADDLKIVEETRKQMIAETKEMRDKTISVFKDIGSYASKIYTGISNVVSKVMSSVISVVKSAWSSFTNIVKFNVSDSLDSILAFEDSILSFFVETLPQLPYYLDSVFQSMESLILTLANTFQSVGFQDLVTNIITSLSEGIANIINLIGQLSENVSLDDFISNLMNSLLIGLKNISESILENLPKILKFIENLISDIADKLPDLLEVLIPTVLKVMTMIFTSVTNILTENVPKIVPVVSKLLDENLPDMIKAFVSLITSIATMLPQIIIDILPTLIHSVTTLVVSLVEALPDIITTLVNALPDIIDLIIKEIPALISDVLNAVLKALPEIITILLTKLPDIIMSLITGIFNLFKGLIFDVDWAGIGQGIWDSIVAVFSGIGKWFEDLWDVVKIPFEAFGKWCSDLWDGLVSGIKKLWDGLGTFFETIWKGIKTPFENFGKWFKDLWDGIGKWFGNLWDGIVDGFYAVVNYFIDGLNDFIGGINWMLDWANIEFSYIPRLSRNGSSNGISKVASNVATDFATMKGAMSLAIDAVPNAYASGTNNALNGLALVGEAGPELVRFRGGEQVLNSHNTQKALNGMSGTVVNQNVTFNNLQDTTAFAMIQQLKQYNRQMAINGII